MKKYIVYIFLGLGVCVVFFFAGYKIGTFGMERQCQLRDSYLAVINASAAYSSLADIAQEIQEKRESKALCLLNVQASAQVNTVRVCLGNYDCKKMVESEIGKIAPELLEHSELRIRYYKEGELCAP